MKIRFLLYDIYGYGGGVLRVVSNLAEALAQRHDVELVGVLRRTDQPVHRLPEGVRARTLVDVRPDRPRRALGAPLRAWAESRPSRLLVPDDPRYEASSLYSDAHIARYVSSVRDGALIGMQPAINLAIARLGRRTAVRVGQEHRPYLKRPQQLREASVRYYGRLDVLLTLTQRDARRYRKLLPASATVRVMPNGVPEYTGSPSTGENQVVAAAGRLERSKGFDRLLRAWARVHASHPDWELRIFGEGTERPALEAQIDALGLGGSARLMGYSNRLLEELATASFFVLSSRTEGYPMVLLEAMSCGLPVVSFDCLTGPREIISHERDGFLVRDGDVKRLSAAIIRMIELGNGRLELAAAALQKAREQSQAVVTARWEQLLLEQEAAKTAQG